MLNIPFVNTYIRIVKHQPVADNVDWLNYYVSSLMLIFCALAISAKQYFGMFVRYTASIRLYFKERPFSVGYLTR